MSFSNFLFGCFSLFERKPVEPFHALHVYGRVIFASVYVSFASSTSREYILRKNKTSDKEFIKYSGIEFYNPLVHGLVILF